MFRRGDVWWVAFGPSIGGEIQKIRPAIIVSNEAANQKANRLQVVPLTSNMKRVYPGEAVVFVENRKGKALANRIHTVNKKRFSNKMATLTVHDMEAVEQAIKEQLAL